MTSECEVQLKLKTDWIQKINAVHGLFSLVAFQYHSKYGMIGTAYVDFLSWYYISTQQQGMSLSHLLSIFLNVAALPSDSKLPCFVYSSRWISSLTIR